MHYEERLRQIAIPEWREAYLDFGVRHGLWRGLLLAFWVLTVTTKDLKKFLDCIQHDFPVVRREEGVYHQPIPLTVIPLQVRTFVIAGVEMATGKAEANRVDRIKESPAFKSFWKLLGDNVDRVEGFFRGGVCQVFCEGNRLLTRGRAFSSARERAAGAPRGSRVAAD